jgi:hypothetical protein
MKTPTWFLIAVALVVAAVVWLLFWSDRPDTTEIPALPPSLEAQPTPTPAPEADVRYPVPTPAPPPEDGDPEAPTPSEPLPALRDSDAPFRRALLTHFGDNPLDRWLAPDALIQRVVATLNTLDQPTPVALRLRPLAHVPGLYQVIGDGDTLTTNDDNARRYDPYVQMLEQADTEAWIGLYLHYYPLFQAAYEELGFPGRHFNDRLIDVIDHLLETPEIEGPIPLARPKVLYRYADPDTEARSWGQKTLIRMGPRHQRAVKTKLRALREALVQRPAETSNALPQQ